ncbi:MAG: acyl dehydratase [Dehalococcoidia bacterium]|nr:MAG: acyl dehydratase [Dehalococcoidia bacterium]
MEKQLYYEDVAEESRITRLVKQPTTTQLVMWAGASGDYNAIHYDKDYALKRGLPGVIVHGQLAGAFLGQMLTDWAGDKGNLKKLSLSYKGMNFPGEILICKGKIVKKYFEDNQYLITLKIWVENPRSEKTLTGMAVINLPSKNDI